ncbi:MAG: hypothetical protein ACE5JF_09325 [Anaerolineales bacterium]
MAVGVTLLRDWFLYLLFAMDVVRYDLAIALRPMIVTKLAATVYLRLTH